MRSLGVSLLLSCSAGSLGDRPNVLFMIGDDLNDNIGHLGHPISKTPTMDRLASEGVSFKHAYANHPICGPSRTSLLSGIYGQTSGVYYFQQSKDIFNNPILSQSKTFIQYFADNGYKVIGTGKVHHYERATPENPRDGWAEYGANADYSPFSFNGTDRGPHPDLPYPLNDPEIYDFVDLNFAPLSDVPYGGENGKGWVYANSTILRYTSDEDRDPTPDEWNAKWAANKIRELSQNPIDSPWLLAVGFIRPHSPNYVPDRYFDMYPLDTIPNPGGEHSVNDTHYRDVLDPAQIPNYPNGIKFYSGLQQAYPEDGIRRWTRGYLAGVRATDDNFGVVIDALDTSAFRDNTIVIITGDHGWANGQHGWVYKNAPWEAATRVPLIFRAPGVVSVPGSLIDTPVSLIDIYPTLKDLCNLTGDTRKSDAGAPLDGFSLRPLLEGSKEWNGPAGAVTSLWGAWSRPELLPPGQLPPQSNKQSPDDVCTTNTSCQDWAFRTQDWRYIRYVDGSEELYHYDEDPGEQQNRANDPSAADTKATMLQQLRSLMGRSNYIV